MSSPKVRAQQRLYWHKHKDKYNAARTEKRRERGIPARVFRKAVKHEKRKVLKGKQRWARYLLMKKKYTCKRENIRFHISVADLMPMPTHCPVLGMRLAYSGKPKENYATIDRIRPSKGYAPGNVRVISMRANRLKNDATIEEVRRVLSYMRSNANSTVSC